MCVCVCVCVLGKGHTEKQYHNYVFIKCSFLQTGDLTMIDRTNYYISKRNKKCTDSINQKD